VLTFQFNKSEESTSSILIYTTLTQLSFMKIEKAVEQIQTFTVKI